MCDQPRRFRHLAGVTLLLYESPWHQLSSWLSLMMMLPAEGQSTFPLCRMRRTVEKNATSLARRFRNLAGLKLLLSDELAALEAAKRRAVSALDDLSEACTHRPQTLVEQACRIPEAGPKTC